MLERTSQLREEGNRLGGWGRSGGALLLARGRGAGTPLWTLWASCLGCGWGQSYARATSEAARAFEGFFSVGNSFKLQRADRAGGCLGGGGGGGGEVCPLGSVFVSGV